MISFIHIGKTGGTSVDVLLKSKLLHYKQYHLGKNYNTHEKYIIWVRNPISRFVSAFNHSYYAVHTDRQAITAFDLDHCLIPQRMKKAIKSGYVFSTNYDLLVRSFNGPNMLAESLSSSDVELRKRATDLMNCLEEHLKKGIGWYLDNGEFVKRNNGRILFVGRMENMEEDVVRLSKILGVTLDAGLKLRENIYVDKSMKYMSPLAIKNVIEWYKDTDYKALNVLVEKGWVSSETLKSYNYYRND